MDGRCPKVPFSFDFGFWAVSVFEGSSDGRDRIFELGMRCLGIFEIFISFTCEKQSDQDGSNVEDGLQLCLVN